MILDQIAADTRLRVEAKKKEISLEEVKRDTQSMEKNTGFPFETALRKPDLSFICEVKKASPSKGSRSGCNFLPDRTEIFSWKR